MNLTFNIQAGLNYKSIPQKIRVLSELWLKEQVYCPNCGSSIDKYKNNQPVKDFYCKKCSEDFELKSKNGNFVSKVVDGAYSTMIKSVTNSLQPNFFLLSYDINTYSVKELCIIPKHFFIPNVIEKRKPLAENARRRGWIGCNIILTNIPQSGKVFYIRNSKVEVKDNVLQNWNKTLFLREKSLAKSKGWLVDIMNCIDRIGKKDFTLNEIYKFEDILRKLHPENNYVKDKIRQQLQVLRDKGYLMFTNRGNYKII
jgi:type II restriction enzyme